MSGPLLFFGILVISLLCVGIFIIYFKLSSLQKPADEKDKYLMLQEALNSTTKNLMAQLNEMRRSLDLQSKTVGERLDGAAKAYSDVKSHLTKLEEANKRIYDVGKDIATLQEILRSPKLRGGLGELSLENLLETLPKDMYQLQYAFKDGKKVDAIIRFKENTVPIDAKFSLENFQKYLTEKEEKEKQKLRKAFIGDVKKRIDETAEYIRPDEGTLDFALMYIPAENVYYEVIIKDEDQASLDEYARQKHVVPVSPNNLFAYLKTILMGFRGMQIQKEAKQILQSLTRLKGDFGKFHEEFDVLGSHLTNARNKYDQSEKFLLRISDKLEQIELTAPEKETKLLEKSA